MKYALIVALLLSTPAHAEGPPTATLPASCPITQQELTAERMTDASALMNCADAVHVLARKIDSMENPPSRLLWLSLGLASGLAVGLAAGYAR